MIRYLLFIFSCVSLFVHAQSSTTISDNFISNKLGWFEDDSLKIEKGYYEINAPEGGWMTNIYPHINTEADFILEAAFTQVDGIDNYGFGFMWGYNKEVEKHNTFIIASTGFLQVYSSDESKIDSARWIETTLVKPIMRSNHLKIEKTKGHMNFYLNDHLVFSSPALPWFGRSLGFVCYARMKFRIDDFVFMQEEKINLPENLKTGLVKENLGPQINTKYNEVTPNISADGKMLFFGRKSSPDNLGGEEDATDIWVSTTKDGRTWSTAKNLGAPVNSELVDNMVSISPDNNSILVALAEDFQLFKRSSDGWHDAGTLGVSYKNENEYFEACQSADGKAILFVAENEKNIYYKKWGTEKDLYVVLKDHDGKWGAPINLGPKINSNGDEATPFLAADGRTLYFATDGRPGYGYQDIFMSKRIGNGWTNWTEPVNLGPEINTYAFEAYYTVPASGDYAYMVSSSPGGYGEADLIRIKLPKEIKPDPVVLIYGKVLNAKTKQPIKADIFFEDIGTGKEVGEAISNPQTGEFRIVLHYGAQYGFRAVADGFLSIHENIELIQASGDYKEIQEDLALVPIEIGQAMQLQNVFFVQGKQELKPESYLELDRLADILTTNPAIEIEVSGHTDNRGDVSANYDLSDTRAKAVIAYLETKGVSKKRMQAKGYGGSKPMVPNDTDEHRQMNRRVEFKIIKK
jgi:outer membrane protein OmpA-like peptidoglycan-associated protein